MKFNKLIPELNVTNLKKSLDFYVKTLGFKTEYERKESKFAFVSYEGTQIMLEQNPNSTWNTGKLEHPFGRGVNFQIIVKSINIIYNKLKKNKYPIKLALKESHYRKNNKILAVREFLVVDPDGYLLRFQQTINKKDD